MLVKPDTVRTQFERDVTEGLSNTQKSLPCQWLYDQRGSELFEEITHLPEYYPTRTETAILRAHAKQIVQGLGPNPALIEYGAGASVKTRIILDAFENLAAYIPIDVSADFLLQTAEAIRRDYPGCPVHPVIADFLSEITLPALPEGANRIGFFPGSTIGNLSDIEIHQFLNRARHSLGEGSHFILGFDLRKSPDILIPAYDDAQGITAAFNLNLLTRINRELSADFDLGAFTHEARWKDELSRIEMHLVSTRRQTVKLAGLTFEFDQGETIHTENSRKFSKSAMLRMCEAGGWTCTQTFTDPDDLFAVCVLKAR